MSPVAIAGGLVLGLVIGMISGLIGIGGGAFLIPALITEMMDYCRCVIKC